MKRKHTKWLLLSLLCLTACTVNDTNLGYDYILEDTTIKCQNLKSERVDLEKENTLNYIDNEEKNTVFYFSYPVQNENMNKFDFKFMKNTGDMSESYSDYELEYDAYHCKWLYPEMLTTQRGILGVDDGGGQIRLSLSNWNESTYSKQKIETRYGDEREAVIYKNSSGQAAFYNTLTGFISETDVTQTLDTIEWEIITDDYEIGKTNPYYITFCNNKDENDIQYIFQTMGCYDKNGNFYECKIDLQCDNGVYHLKLSMEALDKNCYPLTVLTSFERYASKAIIDSETNTEMDFNSYLKSYTILGEHEKYGASELNVRFSTTNLPKINPSDIQSAKLRIKNLSNDPVTIEAYMIEQEWCSWTVVHDKKPLQGNLIGESVLEDDGYYYIDITELYKSYLVIGEEKLTEQGICLKVKEGYTVLPTADNSLYPISVVINYE